MPSGVSSHDGLDLGVECLNPECNVVWDSLSNSAYSGICDRCDHCLDCGSDWIQCMCYDPTFKGEYKYESLSY